MTGKTAWVVVVGMIVAAGITGAGWAVEAAAVGSTGVITHMPDAINRGEPSAVATIYCIGVMWPIEGDWNGSARCAVEFREAGSDKWLPAMPLYRKVPAAVPERRPSGNRPAGAARPYREDDGTGRYIAEHMAANYLAGSIFNLKPGTAYEVKLVITDREVGLSAEKVLTAKTRVEPVMPEAGTKIEVTAEGGAKALSAALGAAKAGDIIIVHAGTYEGPFRVGASGTAEKPIVIRGAGDGPAVVKGKGYVKNYEGEGDRVCLQIDGSHVIVDGMEFEDAVTAINIGAGRLGNKKIWDELQASGKMLTGIVITHCVTRKTQYAVVGTANECYIADNDMTGLATDVEGIDWSEGEGVEVRGSGTVVCYNRMYHLADAVSIYTFTSNQDVYNNETYANSDDGIEVDYSEANNRVWDNRFWYPANNGVSFQPYVGGPVYIIRNEVIGPKENSLKDRFGARDGYFINNTFVGHKEDPAIGTNCQLSYFDMPRNCVSRNNLYVLQDATDMPAVNVHAEDPVSHTIDMDYDGLGGIFVISSNNGGRQVDPALYPGSHYVDEDGLYVPIEAFRKVARTLEHYTLVEAGKIFEHEFPALHDWRVETPRELMTLKEGANAIDAGVVVPTVTDGYVGKAPDLGAHEFGKAAPHYGPRAHSTSRSTSSR